MKKNNFWGIIFIAFFYLDLITCIFATSASLDNYIDNNQVINIVLLAVTAILSFFISYYIIDIIFHEFGHLVLGYFFNWKIYSFNILGISIERKNKKINIFRAPISDLGGYVEMAPRNEKQNLILPMLGGIIMNILLCIVFIIVIILTDNPFVLCISVSFVFSNLVMAINNSVPYTPNSITKTDMYQIKEMNESKKNGTFKYYIKYIELYNICKKKQIKDIDDSYFLLDVENNSPYLDLIHFTYLNKLISLEKFDVALNKIDELLMNEKIDESNRINISFLKLFCMIMTKESSEKVEELYNSNMIKDNEKNLEYFMSIELYAYYKIIDANKEKTKYYEELSNKRIKNTNNKYEKMTLTEQLNYVNNIY